MEGIKYACLKYDGAYIFDIGRIIIFCCFNEIKFLVGMSMKRVREMKQKISTNISKFSRGVLYNFEIEINALIQNIGFNQKLVNASFLFVIDEMRVERVNVFNILSEDLPK